MIVTESQGNGRKSETSGKKQKLQKTDCKVFFCQASRKKKREGKGKGTKGHGGRRDHQTEKSKNQKQKIDKPD